jgi:hypothetical protein
MLADRRYASTGITTTHLTLARLTATTGLIGLRAECLLAPGRGMAGDARGVGVVGVAAGVDAGGADADSSVDEVLTVDAALPADVALHAVRLAASTAARLAVSMVVARSIVEAADSTVAAVVDSTVVVADMAAADIGNPGLIQSPLSGSEEG